MRFTMPALALALALGLAPAVHGQTGPEPVALQGYALQLQEAEARLRQARDAAARAPAQRQDGAVAAERSALAIAGQDAFRVLQNAPPGFADRPAYEQAERSFRQELVHFGATQGLGEGDTIPAADRALRSLAELRRHITQATGAEGTPSAVPPATVGGGTAR